MESTIAFLALIGIVTIPPLWFLFRDIHKNRRENELRVAPFPEEYCVILEEQFPFYKRIPESLKAELHGDILIFLEEKRFEGCNGFELTEEKKLIIAAQACVLLLNHTQLRLPQTDHGSGLSRSVCSLTARYLRSAKNGK